MSAIVPAEQTGPLVVVTLTGGLFLVGCVAVPLLIAFEPIIATLMVIVWIFALRRRIGHHPWLIGVSAVVVLLHLGLGVLGGWVWLYGLELE